MHVGCAFTVGLLALIGPDRPQPSSPNREILEPVVEAVRRSWRMPAMLLLDRSPPSSLIQVARIPSPCTTDSIRRQEDPLCDQSVIDSIPAGLFRAARGRGKVRTRWDASDLPPATELIPGSIIDSFAHGGDKYWEAFRARFPGRRGYLVLSRPIVSASGLEAAIDVEFRCGPLCGDGNFVVLGRKSLSDPWRIIRWRNWWIS